MLLYTVLTAQLVSVATLTAVGCFVTFDREWELDEEKVNDPALPDLPEIQS